MRVFKSWLIANYENIMAAVLIILFEFLLFTSDTIPLESRYTIAGWGTLLLLMGIGIIGGAGSRSSLMDIFNLLVMTVAYIAAFYAITIEILGIPLWICIISLCTSGCMAISAALFTAKHINEVLSRRMLYFNSNVSLFEITWKYTLNRFVIVFNNTTLLFFMLAFGHYYL